MDSPRKPPPQGGEHPAEQENKILPMDENEYKIVSQRKKKKKKKKKSDDEQAIQKYEEEKIAIFENNEIVEYEARNFRTGNNNHIVLLEEDYLNVLEFLIEKKFFPDLYKYKNDGDISEKFQKNVHDFTPSGKSTMMNYEGYSPEEGRYMDLNQGGRRSRTQMGSGRFPSGDFDRGYYSNQEEDNPLEMLYPTDNISERNVDRSEDGWNDQALCVQEKKYKLVTLANGKKHKINLNMNLREFQRKYTSEDNKSFEYLLRSMKNKNVDKNMYSLMKRKEHNKKVDYIEECTRKGINCYQVNTNKSENELSSMMFSSNLKVSLMDSAAESKVQICHDNTRFSQEYNEDMKRQIKQCAQNRQLKMMEKMKEEKEEQMVQEGKFNLLPGNNTYEYISTPVILAGKGVDKNPIITWGIIASSPKLVESDDDYNMDSSSDEESDNVRHSIRGRRDIGQEKDETDFNPMEEFSLQQINERERIAEKLQNNMKDIKYNKEALKRKNLSLLIHRNCSSRMSTTSYRNSVLSNYSRKRLSELAMKSSLASKILKKKR
ncbi:ES2 protein, putative [Plasmodium knowlesi strain H]|uniref:ES2 protein, putative n=3 Tax=Plasmodium knowlesi TaxID=5850 RepID=A0A5K1VS62_PLAKH|nr:ES2 protein, putative [Plasmodium knowlesi strain H]OTN64875.1 putative ES2 protein [Plasmodium knowlesi]CAA9988133.1 ES2 protein, putative [Plasmodium knowlesi strain H]SBO20019.1 ES2 protein, putative [Plasmodium knowlesi strain H]SBO20809.1 ES2 protein, putative [Plasmodium knowlesi strain H]VVS77607.1 ES2 protein, putative [Plasmodium knowlesi strain H]|eukprot:XP_002259109.1 hypothetical protein, conserved in Plasmodium species [Plasmodium knowlesi strain H]